MFTLEKDVVSGRTEVTTDLARLKLTYMRMANEAMSEAVAEAKAALAADIKQRVDAPAIRLECLRIAHGDIGAASSMVAFVMKEATDV